jgi:N-acetylglucosaminyldiphosphoundecaprenol N-acetyl-beta-D-mannosaminyltransferase
MNDPNIKILGVRIDKFSKPEVERKLLAALEREKGNFFVTTLNPEILLQGHRNRKYRNVLNSADLNVCDGMGVKFASIFKGSRIKSRYAGADMAEFLLKAANKRNSRVLIVMREDSLSKPLEIEDVARNKFGIQASAVYRNEPNFFEKDEIKEAALIFTNFGSPEQEEYIFENRHRFPNARILIGVGGTFDFLTGKFSRAPLWLRKIGLEWFWRFLMEPKRIKRIFNAVAVFPLNALFYKDD